jgi:hypothetical protein
VNTMNVGDLKKALEQYPDDMDILVEEHSDYIFLNHELCSIIEAVDQSGYVMRAHPTMSEENKAKTKKYLLLGRN